MILEADEETRDFVTIYNKDYPPKRCKKLSKFIQPLNYNPPLNVFNGPFKEYLNSLRENERVSAEEKTEDIRDNLKRVRLKYKHLDKFIPDTPPNEDVIESEKKKAYKTIYQLEYSQHLDDYFSLYAKRTGRGRVVSLPDGWTIPETIHKRSYRNPGDLSTSSNIARTRDIRKPVNNLDPSEKERKILRITTGLSEYGNIIGATGERIFKEQLHGPPLPLDPPPLPIKGPDSPRSDCTKLLKSTNRPFISNVF